MRLLFFAAAFGLALAATADGQKAADLIIVNGNVVTMDGSKRAEAVAVTGNRIVSVGSSIDIRKLATPLTRIIDARRGTVLPGFNDSHVHFMAIGNKFSTLDLKELATSAEMLSRIRIYTRFLPKGRWILGSGGSDNLFKNVTAEQLDAAAPDNPVFLYGSERGSALANTAAFRAAGVKQIMPGIVNAAAFGRLKFAVPADHTRQWEEIAETASNYAASFGITSVQDTDSDDHVEAYRRLAVAGKLNVRIYDCHGLPRWKDHAAAGLKAGSGDAMVRSGCLKGTADVDEVARAQLFAAVAAADRAGMQVLLHAIGEEMVTTAVEAFGAAAKANGERDRRFRVEHGERAAAEDQARAGAIGAIFSVQPFLFNPGSVHDGYYSMLAKSGIRLALGSDAPMTDIDPLRSLIGIDDADQKAPFELESSIAAYTAGAAFAEFQETVKGRIIPGMLADLVILNRDIFRPSSARTENTFVVTTVMNGKITYEFGG